MASENQKHLDAENAKYAANFDKGGLPIPPAKKYLIGAQTQSYSTKVRDSVTCMDSRIDNFDAFGIKLGDAHIIRNAGGNAVDALRSILISQHFLGTREVILIKHTGCGMLTFTNAQAVEKIEGANGKGVVEAGFDFQPYPDTEQAVRDDVTFLRGHGALVKGTVVSGWVYDVKTGRVSEVKV